MRGIEMRIAASRQTGRAIRECASMLDGGKREELSLRLACHSPVSACYQLKSIGMLLLLLLLRGTA